MSNATIVQSRKTKEVSRSSAKGPRTQTRKDTERRTANQPQPRAKSPTQHLARKQTARARSFQPDRRIRRPPSATAPVQPVNLPNERRRPRNRFFESITLEKGFVVFGFAVAIGMMLPFGTDLATGFPFHRASTSWDIAAVLCGAGLAYLSWDTYRDHC